MVRFIDPEFRIGPPTKLPRDHIREDSGQAGLIGHNAKVVHHLGVFGKRVRDAGGVIEQRELLVLLLRVLNAVFDIPNGLGIFLDLAAICRA